MRIYTNNIAAMKSGGDFFARGGVSRLGLGVWTTFGERVDFPAARRIFRAARDAGINHFDAAADYADGLGEEFLGRLADGECFVSTKIAAPQSPDGAMRGVWDAVANALSRLRRERLDLLYCRAPTDSVLPLLPSIFDALIREGKIARWGASNWPPQALRDVAAVCEVNHFAMPAAAQAPGNFLFAGPLLALRDLAAMKEIALVGYSPFARGVLAGRYLRGVPAKSRLANPRQARHIRCGESEKNLAREIVGIAKAQGATAAKIVLQHAFARLPIAAMVAGASSPAQVRRWAAAKDDAISPATLKALDAAFARRGDGG